MRHDDVIKWKYFPRSWPFVRGIHRSPVNSPHQKASDAELWCFFDLRLNKRLNKQSRGWWFETPSCSLWRQCNGLSVSHKEPINPIRFPASLAPIIWALHWMVYVYVDKMLLVFLRCMLFNLIVKSQWSYFEFEFTVDFKVPGTKISKYDMHFMYRYDIIYVAHLVVYPLQWCHNELNGALNHQRFDCLLNRLFGRRPKKTPKLCVTGLYEGNSAVTGEFPAQRASNAKKCFHLMTPSCEFNDSMLCTFLLKTFDWHLFHFINEDHLWCPDAII